MKFCLFFGLFIIILTITLAIFYNNPLFLLFLLLLVLIIWRFFKIFDAEIKRVYKEIHSGLSYFELRIRRLRRFLKEESLDHSKDKVVLLIELVDKNVNENKVPFLVGRGMLAALIIPLWAQSIGWVFNKQIDNANNAAAFIIVLLCLIIVIWYFISFWKYMVHDEIINGDYNILKRMANDLRELLFKD